MHSEVKKTSHLIQNSIRDTNSQSFDGSRESHFFMSIYLR